MMTDGEGKMAAWLHPNSGVQLHGIEIKWKLWIEEMIGYEVGVMSSLGCHHHGIIIKQMRDTSWVPAGLEW